MCKNFYNKKALKVLEDIIEGNSTYLLKDCGKLRSYIIYKDGSLKRVVISQYCIFSEVEITLEEFIDLQFGDNLDISYSYLYIPYDMRDYTLTDSLYWGKPYKKVDNFKSNRPIFNAFSNVSDEVDDYDYSEYLNTIEYLFECVDSFCDEDVSKINEFIKANNISSHYFTWFMECINEKRHGDEDFIRVLNIHKKKIKLLSNYSNLLKKYTRGMDDKLPLESYVEHIHSRNAKTVSVINSKELNRVLID